MILQLQGDFSPLIPALRQGRAALVLRLYTLDSKHARGTAMPKVRLDIDFCYVIVYFSYGGKPEHFRNTLI